MEAMQTLNPADVWDMVQKAIVWLAGIGIVIDLTPGIKIQPVRWLIKQLGNLMNHDLKEQLNQLENDFIEHAFIAAMVGRIPIMPTIAVTSTSASSICAISRSPSMPETIFTGRSAVRIRSSFAFSSSQTAAICG